MKRPILVYLCATSLLFALLYATEQINYQGLQTILYGISYAAPIAVALLLRPKAVEPILPHPMHFSGRIARWTALALPPTLGILLLIALLGSHLFPQAPTSSVIAAALSLPLILRHALLCPLAEECFFRLLPMRLFGKEHVKEAFLISLLCFAVFHSSPARILHALAAAAVFFAIDLLADSLWPSVLLHLGNNTLALVYSAYGANRGFALVFCLVTATLATACLICLLFYRKRIKKLTKDNVTLHRR